MANASRPGRRPPFPVALATATALCLFGVAACSGGSPKRFIPPPPDTVAPVTTAPPASDFTNVVLNPVEGKPPAEKVEILGGDATLSGLIVGPDGPVAGATIRLERFVGDATARLDVVSNADGTWRAPQLAAPPPVPTVPTFAPVPGQPPVAPPPTRAAAPRPTVKATGPQGILGGRYRVRAWRTPDLALTTPQILFVEGKQNKQVTLQLSRYTGTTVNTLVSPDPPVLDAFTSVTAVVNTLATDGDGVVRSAPQSGATVSLSVGSGWLLSGGPSFTNAQGRATFQLRCQTLGQSPVELTVNNLQVFTLPVRGCVPPAPTTTTTLLPFDPGAATTTLPSGPTSTSPGPPTTT